MDSWMGGVNWSESKMNICVLAAVTRQIEMAFD